MVDTGSVIQGASVAVLILGGGGIIGFYKTHKKTVKDRDRFNDKLFGVPAIPDKGLLAEPGIFDVITGLTTEINVIKITVCDIQESAKITSTEVSEIKLLTTQLKANGGNSVFDKIDKLEKMFVQHLKESEQVKLDLVADAKIVRHDLVEDAAKVKIDLLRRDRGAETRNYPEDSYPKAK